ncbi:MAG: hypothetical protein KA715_07920 [Xanthomonadaceae bacterium]|nr:hypothetical protein [Xanthomonadaceae bacterium]
MIFLLLSLLAQDVSAKSTIDVECFVTWVSPNSDLDEGLSVWGDGDEDYSKIWFSQNSKGKVEAKIGGFHYRNTRKDIVSLEDADDFVYVSIALDVVHNRPRERFSITYVASERTLRLDHKKENSKRFYKLASARCR